MKQYIIAIISFIITVITSVVLSTQTNIPNYILTFLIVIMYFGLFLFFDRKNKNSSELRESILKHIREEEYQGKKPPGTYRAYKNSFERTKKIMPLFIISLAIIVATLDFFGLTGRSNRIWASLSGIFLGLLYIFIIYKSTKNRH